MENSPKQETELDFQKKIAYVQGNLERDFAKNPESISIGPRFHMQTYKGHSLEVATMFHSYQSKGGGIALQKEKVLLVAYEANQPVGVRSQTIGEDFMNDPETNNPIKIDELISKGEIVSGIRHHGIASAIETALKLITQNKSTHDNKRIIQEVVNNNLSKLVNAKKEYSEATFSNAPQEELESLRRKYNNRQEEQKTWQSLYNSTDNPLIKFAGDYYGYIFEPKIKSENEPNFLDFQDIYMERINNKNVISVQSAEDMRNGIGKTDDKKDKKEIQAFIDSLDE